MGKISKIGNGKYANKKVFLNHVKPERYKYKLSSFNPGVNKSQSLVGFIKNQVGLGGLSEISKETAGTTVNMLLDIKRVWQNEAKLRPELYEGNIRRMSKGLAPKVAGKSMHLHHVIGKANDMYTVVKMTQPQHILFHKTFGYHVNAAWSWETLIKFMG